jgi:hypothetical protein
MTCDSIVCDRSYSLPHLPAHNIYTLILIFASMFHISTATIDQHVLLIEIRIVNIDLYDISLCSVFLLY